MGEGKLYVYKPPYPASCYRLSIPVGQKAFATGIGRMFGSFRAPDLADVALHQSWPEYGYRADQYCVMGRRVCSGWSRQRKLVGLQEHWTGLQEPRRTKIERLLSLC